MSEYPQDRENVVGHAVRALYTSSSRRSALASLGRACLKLLGISMLALLPVDRIVKPAMAQSICSSNYLCGIWGTLCASGCQGCGTTTSCSSCSTAGGSWTACCPNGSGTTLVTYIDCCTNVQSCAAACAVCTVCHQNPEEQATWCGGFAYYVCTIISLGQSCG
jgi:hypothetical protein